jgi:hypothetical protein
MGDERWKLWSSHLTSDMDKKLTEYGNRMDGSVMEDKKKS